MLLEACAALTMRSAWEWDVQASPEQLQLLVQVLDVLVTLLHGPHKVPVIELNGVTTQSINNTCVYVLLLFVFILNRELSLHK